METLALATVPEAPAGNVTVPETVPVVGVGAGAGATGLSSLQAVNKVKSTNKKIDSFVLNIFNSPLVLLINCVKFNGFFIIKSVYYKH
jgi:hypothetical protein